MEFSHWNKMCYDAALKKENMPFKMCNLIILAWFVYNEHFFFEFLSKKSDNFHSQKVLFEFFHNQILIMVDPTWMYCVHLFDMCF